MPTEGEPVEAFYLPAAGCAFLIASGLAWLSSWSQKEFALLVETLESWNNMKKQIRKEETNSRHGTRMET